MKCLACNKTIADNAKFCNFCGSNQAELKIAMEKKQQELRADLERLQAELKVELDEREGKKKIAHAALMHKVRKYGLLGLAGAAIVVGLFFAYDKSQGANLVDIKAIPLTDSPSKSLVMDTLKASFKNYVPANECYITSYQIENAQQLFCIKLSGLYDSKENGADYIYITLSGIGVDENFQPIEAHANAGSLEFLKLKNEAGKLKVVSRSNGILSGSWGKPGIAVITPLGKENIGWVLVDGYGGMGEASTFLSLFAVAKNKINRVFAITPVFSNKDACSAEDKSCAFQQIDLTVKQDKNQQLFYPLKVSGTITKGSISQSTKITKDYVIKFNQGLGAYELPQDLSNLFND